MIANETKSVQRMCRAAIEAHLKNIGAAGLNVFVGPMRRFGPEHIVVHLSKMAMIRGHKVRVRRWLPIFLPACMRYPFQVARLVRTREDPFADRPVLVLIENPEALHTLLSAEMQAKPMSNFIERYSCT